MIGDTFVGQEVHCEQAGDKQIRTVEMTRALLPGPSRYALASLDTCWFFALGKAAKNSSFPTFPPCLRLLAKNVGFSPMRSVTNHSEREHARVNVAAHLIAELSPMVAVEKSPSH